MIAVSCQAAAAKLVAKSCISLRGKEVSVEQVGPQVHHVSVFRLPQCVKNDALVHVLGAYRKPTTIDYVTLLGRRDIKDGTRIVRMTMNKPVFNFIVIQGKRVMVE